MLALPTLPSGRLGLSTSGSTRIYVVGCGACNGVTCARLLAARCRCSARYQDQRYPPETSARHKRAIRRKPESGIQVRKGYLMSLPVVHETVLHVAQMRPETWEAVGILSGSPRRARPRPIAAAGNAGDRPTATGFVERRHDLLSQGKPPAIGRNAIARSEFLRTIQGRAAAAAHPRRLRPRPRPHRHSHRPRPCPAKVELD